MVSTCLFYNFGEKLVNLRVFQHRRKTMFMPKQKKRRAEKDPLQAHEKRRRLQEIVFTAEEPAPGVEKIVTYTAESTHHFAESESALIEKQQNCLQSALLAMELYLSPKTVLLTALYWLSQYVNCDIPATDWFNSLVQDLLRHPIRLSLTGSEGTNENELPLKLQHFLLLHFAGSPLHKIPSEYFTTRGNGNFADAMAHLTEPDNGCFLARNSFGLHGEVEARCFLYDRLLAHFYEPSFHVLTLYMVYVTMLRHMSGARVDQDWLPAVAHATTPLKWALGAREEVQALNVNNANYEEKWRLFHSDLQSLLSALESDGERQDLPLKLEQLWLEKVIFLEEEKWRRLEQILTNGKT